MRSWDEWISYRVGLVLIRAPSMGHCPDVCVSLTFKYPLCTQSDLHQIFELTGLQNWTLSSAFKMKKEKKGGARSIPLTIERG